MTLSWKISSRSFFVALSSSQSKIYPPIFSNPKSKDSCVNMPCHSSKIELYNRAVQKCTLKIQSPSEDGNGTWILCVSEAIGHPNHPLTRWLDPQRYISLIYDQPFVWPCFFRSNKCLQVSCPKWQLTKLLSNRGVWAYGNPWVFPCWPWRRHRNVQKEKRCTQVVVLLYEIVWNQIAILDQQLEYGTGI